MPGAGRPPDAIVTQNFIKLRKLNDKSNRYELECIHCLTKIINRDNNHIKHISKQLRAEKDASTVAGIPENEVDGNEILEGRVYDFTELEAIDKGLAPTNAVEDLNVIGDADSLGWDTDTMMVEKGIL